jgi:hypothetical protein
MLRRILWCLPCILALFLLLSEPAFAGKWAYTGFGDCVGISSDVWSPVQPLTGNPSGRTVKAAIWVHGSYGLVTNDTHAGWQVRPGVYNDPKPFYLWYDQNQYSHETMLSGTQAYNTKLWWEIIQQKSGLGFPLKDWAIVLNGTPVQLSTQNIDQANPQEIRAGGKTSSDTFYLEGKHRNINYMSFLTWQWALLPSSSSIHQEYPLILVVQYPNCNVDIATGAG